MSPEMPETGKCGECDDQIEFYEDGSGVCMGCGRIIWWDKSKDPENPQEEEQVEEEIEEELDTPETASAPVEAQAPPVQPPVSPQQPPVPPQQPYAPGAAPYPAPYPDPYAAQYPPTPMTDSDLDPGTRKAWKKMKKRFKGGVGPGAAGGILAGIVFIVLPLVLYFIYTFIMGKIGDGGEADINMSPGTGKLLAIPIMIGWMMVVLGAAKKYYRRGTFQRAISGATYQGGKGLFIYALVAPFVFGIGASAGDDGGLGAHIDLSGYFTILYILMGLSALYSIMEYFAFKEDLEAYYNGEIPLDYYPREQRVRIEAEREQMAALEQQPMAPPQQGYPPQGYPQQPPVPQEAPTPTQQPEEPIPPQ